MCLKEKEQKMKELVEILQKEDAHQRLGDLVKLAREVGASTTRFETVVTSTGFVHGEMIRNAITETEIVQNIHKQRYRLLQLLRCAILLQKTSGLQ